MPPQAGLQRSDDHRGGSPGTAYICTSFPPGYHTGRAGICLPMHGGHPSIVSVDGSVNPPASWHASRLIPASGCDLIHRADDRVEQKIRFFPILPGSAVCSMPPVSSIDPNRPAMLRRRPPSSFDIGRCTDTDGSRSTVPPRPQNHDSDPPHASLRQRGQYRHQARGSYRDGPSQASPGPLPIRNHVCTFPALPVIFLASNVLVSKSAARIFPVLKRCGSEPATVPSATPTIHSVLYRPHSSSLSRFPAQ